MSLQVSRASGTNSVAGELWSALQKKTPVMKTHYRTTLEWEKVPTETYLFTPANISRVSRPSSSREAFDRLVTMSLRDNKQWGSLVNGHFSLEDNGRPTQATASAFHSFPLPFGQCRRANVDTQGGGSQTLVEGEVVHTHTQYSLHITTIHLQQHVLYFRYILSWQPFKLVALTNTAILFGKRTKLYTDSMLRCSSCILYCHLVVWCTLCFSCLYCVAQNVLMWTWKIEKKKNLWRRKCVC